MNEIIKDNDMQANPVGIVKKDIYVITNKINNKQYVGQSVNAEERFRGHCKNYTSEVSLINRAIKKYGKDNFELQILESQIENYNEREKYWIKTLNTLVPNGYNIAEGGEEPPHFYGDNHHHCVISDKNVFNLKCDLKYTDTSLSKLAEKYNISKRQVMRINEGLSRVEDGYTYPIRKNPNINGKLSEEDVNTIIDLLKYTYFLNGTIARMFYVEVHAIDRINDGTSHHRDNIIYPIRKWRSSGNILFTYDEVTEIINLLQNTNLSIREIANIFEVDVSGVYLINKGTSKKYRRDNVEYPIRKLTKRT